MTGDAKNNNNNIIKKTLAVMLHKNIIFSRMNENIETRETVAAFLEEIWKKQACTFFLSTTKVIVNFVFLYYHCLPYPVPLYIAPSIHLGSSKAPTQQKFVDQTREFLK
uniref:Uncharacterized protein n=1 Tax=Romanomermis culicivorax TaxID=13658 RepID=A0A915HHM7_ROMCU